MEDSWIGISLEPSLPERPTLGGQTLVISSGNHCKDRLEA